MSTSNFAPTALDIRALTVLAAQTRPIGSFEIYGQIPDATAHDVETSLKVLKANGLIDSEFISCDRWLITPEGAQVLATANAHQSHDRVQRAEDAVQAVADRMRGKTGVDPLQVTLCHRQEPQSPATALLCVDEDELDDWWESLDVEQKADAFVRFALHMYDDECHIYVEPRIPVTGAIGEEAAVAAAAAVQA